MTKEVSATLPVESTTIQAELKSAFARIDSVPAGKTLVDQISKDLWGSGVEDNIAAGSDDNSSDELDYADQEVQDIA